MFKVHFTQLAALIALLTMPLYAGSTNIKIIAELDPIAPASAAYEEREHKTPTSKWGGNVDFNVGNVISTGPELWTGNFTVKGPESPTTEVRREDFQYGEKQKVDATRFRWNFTRWEVPVSMRGWYLRMGYSYTRVNSRANRLTEQTAADTGEALPAGFYFTGPADDATDLVTDIRHGAVLGFGERWLLAEQSMSVTIGISYTANFKRTVSVDSKDPNTRADYDEMIEDLPMTRMSVRPMPEAGLAVGYAW